MCYDIQHIVIKIKTIIKDKVNMLHLTESQVGWEFDRLRIYLLLPFSYLVEMFLENCNL